MSDVSGGQGPRRYMAGDRILVELDLEHRSNLGRVFVAFTHGTDPLTEFYFETASFPEEDRRTGDPGTSRVILEAVVPPETIPGVYTLNRVNVFSVGGRLARLREEDLSQVPGRSFEVVEEPAEPPGVSGLRAHSNFVGVRRRARRGGRRWIQPGCRRAGSKKGEAG